MRVRTFGVVGLGFLAAACGGGEEGSATAWSAEPTAGAERVIVARAAPEPPPGEIVEVIESRLPTSVPRIDMAAAETGTETGATGAEETPAPEPVAQASAPPAQPSLEAAAREICPADIETLQVRAVNVAHGAAILLTARGEADVDRLRQRMREFALAHSTEHAQQCADPSHAGVTVPASPMAASQRIADPASPLLSVHDLRLVEIANGVRVELRYADDVDRVSVRELRARVREDVAALDDGVCPLSFQMT